MVYKIVLENVYNEYAKTRNASGFLMLVGVDNFKEINEKYGAKTGDEVLNILTDSIKKYIDTPLRIFRMPGDECAIFMPYSMENDIFPISDICAKYVINSDLVFAYQAELGDDFPIGDPVARGHDLSPDKSKMPLLIQVREYDHKYVLTAEYRSDMYSEAFVRGMLESYEAAMDSLLKAKYISEVSVLSQNGADTIAEFN